MLRLLKHSGRYLRYLIRSKNAQNIHSPFVFKLLEEVIYNYTPYYVFQPLEIYRKQLLINSKKIQLTDLGAGSKLSANKTKTVANICRHSVKREKFARLLFRLVDWKKPKNILELGTSLGLTTLYLSYANPNGAIYSVEGDPELSEFAQRAFKKFRRKNIQSHTGNFDQKLPEILEGIAELEFVFIDGNHRKEPVLNYFNQCLNKITENSLIIVDDIHWSDEMEEAWMAIQNYEQVSLTINLFEMGLVFFQKRHQKEHFVIRF